MFGSGGRAHTDCGRCPSCSQIEMRFQEVYEDCAATTATPLDPGQLDREHKLRIAMQYPLPEPGPELGSLINRLLDAADLDIVKSDELLSAKAR